MNETYTHPVTFSCEAIGEPVPTINWLFNVVLINDTNKYNISEFANGTVITSVLKIQNESCIVGTYTCEAENRIDRDRKSAVLTVKYGAEVITPLFETKWIKEGQSGKLKCVGAGYPPPLVQWRKLNGSLSDRISITNKLSTNEENITRITVNLVFTEIHREDTGVYECLISSQLKNITRNVSLNVRFQAEVLSVADLLENETNPATFNCQATGRPVPSISWYFKGVMINVSNARHRISNTARDTTMTSLLTINDVQSSDVGTYTCQAENIIGIDQSSGILTVNDAAEILEPSIERPKNIVEGQNTTLRCVGIGYPPPLVQWRKLNGSLSKRVSITNMSMSTNEGNVTRVTVDLIFTGAHKEDAGVYVCSVSNLLKSVQISITIQYVTVDTPYSGITVLQGNNVTLSCRPSHSDIALQWSYNGSDINSSSHYQFTPPSLNHNLTIVNASVVDSGNYVCAFSLPNIKQTISLTVIASCLQDYSSGLLWPTSRRNSLVNQSCSTLHPYFRSRVTIRRKCNIDGTWGPVDDSSCTALNNAIPTLIISFIVNVSQDDAQLIVNNVTHMIISSSNTTLLSNDSILYDLRQSDITGVLIRLTSNEFTENSTSFNTLNKVLLHNKEVKIFIPGLKCRCNLSDEPIRTICIGPSIPPCDCSQTSCECNSPFVGNNGFCGLDTDSDGCPDLDLGCSNSNCFKDLCVNDYTEFPQCNSDEGICNPPPLPSPDMIDTSICLQENDEDWNISWPLTTSGEVAIQKCPGGAESLGLASRLCDGDPAMWHDPNVENCSTVEITKIREEVNNLRAIFAAMQNPNNSDHTLTIEPEVLQTITEELVANTNKDDIAILPNDLENSISIVEDIINIYSSDPTLIGEDTLMNLIDTIDNLYNSENGVAFDTLDRKNEGAESAGAKLLRNVIMLIGLISHTLETDGNKSASFIDSGESIRIEAQLLSEADIERGVNVSFPMNDSNISVQSEVPNPTIKKFAEEYPGPVTNVFLANSFLPSDFDGPGIYNLTSPVQVVHINASGHVELPENDTVSLIFNIPENLTNQVKCVFWQPERNSWSAEGVSTVKDGNDVKCEATHLTSFAVLVDVQDSSSSSTPTALSVISYIGCGISILSLLLTMLAIFYWRKSIYKGVPNFIHFNLALALLIGLIIFVSAIETVKENKPGCTTVAVLLHYFFLAAFVWMLCEGIFLFVFINFVFYKGFLSKWRFYLGLGWGLPVPIVAIAAGIANKHYGSEKGCWLSEAEGTIWAFVAPMVLIIVVNSVFLAASLRVACKSKQKDVTTKVTRIEIARSLLISAITFMPILGSTWIIGLFAVNEHTKFFAWIFTILNSLQGFFIFYFYVLKQQKKINIAEYLQRLSGTFLTTLSHKSKTSSEHTYNQSKAGNDPKSQPSKTESINSHNVTSDDTVKAEKLPTKETSLTVLLPKPSEKEFPNGNVEPDINMHDLTNETLNTSTIICYMNKNADSDFQSENTSI